MEDQKISQLTTITTVDNTADLFPIVDSSASETKKITPSALKIALALDNVNNTSDINKPISNATQTALDSKASITSLSAHTSDTNNPHAVTKSQVGLSNVDNTSDVNKPISSATQTALNLKQDTLTFTPENVANKSTTLDSDKLSNTKYPSVKSVYDWATSLFQTALGYTAENVSNKSTSVTTDQASNTKYPSVKSVYDWAVGLFATISNLATKTDKVLTLNRQTASYTLVSTDADKLVEMNVATANNLTVPSATFSAGQQILLSQYGAGQTTIVAGSGMTIRSNGGKLKLNVQYSGATLVFISASEAYLFGDIA